MVAWEVLKHVRLGSVHRKFRMTEVSVFCDVGGMLRPGGWLGEDQVVGVLGLLRGYSRSLAVRYTPTSEGGMKVGS